MEVKNIEKYFSFEILRRGYDYYKNGKVKEINKTEEGFVTDVNGSELYKIKIKININNGKYDMDVLVRMQRKIIANIWLQYYIV